jgi:hypothetical protein
MESLKYYEGLYEINEEGDIYSLWYNKIMKPSINDNGYLFYKLSKDGVEKKCFQHRLIAIQFIENPENKEEVDHINRKPTDNRIENLRWVIREENRANRETKGCITQWTVKSSGITYYKSTYCIEKGVLKQKSSRNRDVVENWLHAIKKEHPRNNIEEDDYIYKEIIDPIKIEKTEEQILIEKEEKNEKLRLKDKIKRDNMTEEDKEQEREEARKRYHEKDLNEKQRAYLKDNPRKPLTEEQKEAKRIYYEENKAKINAKRKEQYLLKKSV